MNIVCLKALVGGGTQGEVIDFCCREFQWKSEGVGKIGSGYYNNILD